MKQLVLLRGPSGSGKSTIAKTLGGEVFETDDYWCRNGEYNFIPSKIAKAHQWNQDRVEKACRNGVDKVIVSNTNMALWEMQIYLDIASKYEYEVKILRTPGPWDANILVHRNLHNVPLPTLEKQINKYKAHKDETVWKDMSVFTNE